MQMQVCEEGSAEVRVEPKNVGSSVSGGQSGQNVEAQTAGKKGKNQSGGNVGSSGPS